jgi:hypothetical protein
VLNQVVTLPDTRQSRQTRSGSSRLWIAAFLLLIPIGMFWYVWGVYAANVPKWDDHVLRFFLFALDEESSFSGKIYQFVKQHNEHRIVYDRLITWLDYHITGKLNFVHLMFIGNLSLIGLLAVFGRVLSQSGGVPDSTFTSRTVVNWRVGLIYLPPVAFLLLNLSHWENMFWGMAALQNFTVMLWVFLAIYVLAYTQKTGLALVLAVAATLTSGNGLLVWPVGFGMLLLQTGFARKKEYRVILQWVAGAALAFVGYFWGYQKPPGNPPLQSSFFQFIKGWLAFNGSAAEAVPVGPVVGLCVLLGGICLLLVLAISLGLLRNFLSRKPLSPLDFFFLGTVAFLIGTSAVVAWTRTGFGFNTLITSRYKLYSLLLMAVLYTYLASRAGASVKKWVLTGGLLVGSVLMAGSYITYLADTIWWRQWMLTNQFNWSHSINGPAVSRDSISERYTSLAPSFFNSVLPAIYGPARQPPIAVQITKTAEEYEILNTSAPPQELVNAGNFVVARSVKRTYLFPVRQNRGSLRAAIFDSEKLFAAGFRATISPAELETGVYQVLVLNVSAGRASLYPTNQTIQSAGAAGTTTKTNW